MFNAVLLFLALAAPPNSLWLEAESFGPLHGANFSFLPDSQQTRGSWSVAGPDAAPAFTQGGESEFMSIAARADAPAGQKVTHPIEFPASGRFTLWVRYADYRNKQESFGIRVVQGNHVIEHVFGLNPVIDELDPMKLLWDWAYGWDSAQYEVEKGPAVVEIYSTGPTEARRAIDCLCFTTDDSYHPTGREKPDSPAWKLLRSMRDSGMPSVRPLASAPERYLPSARSLGSLPLSWKIAGEQPTFLWNVGDQWQTELERPQNARIDAPFSVDPPLLPDFLTAFRGGHPAIYSSPLSGPVWHIPQYPSAFAAGSPFHAWLDRNPAERFAILLNYGDPTWPKGADGKAAGAEDKKAVYSELKKLGDRFVGFIAGENLDYATVDDKKLNERIGAAKSRSEVLSALREFHTAALAAKLTDYFGQPISRQEAWGPIISCLSATNEAFTHAVCDWGARRIGHENTGNSPTLARRLAFLRGACRQFGARMVDYQSCNLGDSATMFDRSNFLYPASSRYIMDNSYDAFAGAGTAWLLRDYLLWNTAGVDAFYNEQGVDLYWKPGGNSAGDTAPVQLSPKGKVAEAVQQIVSHHPRGVQYTPVAFLLDEAHGYTQERFSPGAFGLDPQLNPAVLTPGDHEASIRGWFDTAYFPAPDTQGEPATAIRQTYVNGIFGDIFDVIVNAPNHTSIADTYPALIVAGEVAISHEWGKALHHYAEAGGTLVVCAEQLTGPGVSDIGLPEFGAVAESSGFRWTPSAAEIATTPYRYHALASAAGEVLAVTDAGKPILLRCKRGKGAIIVSGIPMGLGIDRRPSPLLGLILRHVSDPLTPIHVTGDAEWTLSRLDDGSWVVTLLNNRGIIKPEHGILPTDGRESVQVNITTTFGVARAEEWMANQPLAWKLGPQSSCAMTIAAGAVRMVHIIPLTR